MEQETPTRLGDDQQLRPELSLRLDQTPKLLDTTWALTWLYGRENCTLIPSSINLSGQSTEMTSQDPQGQAHSQRTSLQDVVFVEPSVLVIGLDETN
jgi:hypothetical protein